MDDYIITERAGRFVAGYRNTGVGTALRLTPKQAEHELRLGTLRRAGAPSEAGGDNTTLSDALQSAKADGSIKEVSIDTTPFEAMTVAQLRELAAAQGVELPAGARKADIVAALASFTSDTARGTA